MKPQDIIKSIAELAEIIKPNGELIEGYCWYKGFIWTTDGAGIPDEIWDVTRSRDAIVPVIEKVFNQQGWEKFTEELRKVLKIDYAMRELFIVKYVILATPSQLCEALLRATGKWTDD